MKPSRLLIVYASKHGQTKKIASRIFEIANAADVEANVVSIENIGEYRIESYDALIVTGSVHFGRHDRKLEKFVERKLSTIERMRSAFLSVSGAAATDGGKAEADRYVHDFSRRTGWVPEIHQTVGGAEPYTKYNFLTRILMRSIARKHGRSVDVHRDYEFTDWNVVQQFAQGFIGYASAKKSA